jgi:hypothetical protein
LLALANSPGDFDGSVGARRRLRLTPFACCDVAVQREHLPATSSSAKGTAEGKRGEAGADHHYVF